MEFAAAPLLLSYAAGALSTLSPCVLPLLPIVLFGALEQHPWGPISLAAGVAATFAGLGILVASVGFSLDIDPVWTRSGTAALLVAMGIVLFTPVLQNRLSVAAAPIGASGQAMIERLRLSGLGGQFILGALLGVVWAPCSGPTLGAAIGLAAQAGTAPKAAAMMAAFSIGAVTPLLLLGYGSRRAMARRCQFLARISGVAKPIMGATLVAVGVFVLIGLDKSVEASLTQAMPEWLLNATTRL